MKSSLKNLIKGGSPKLTIPPKIHQNPYIGITNILPDRRKILRVISR